jgi:4-coumarate--CoA ligase
MSIIRSPIKGINLPAPDTIFRHYLPAKPRFPEYPAFIDGVTGRTITSTQLRLNALRLGRGILKLLGGSPTAAMDETVALIFSPNSVDFAQVFYGCQSVKIVTSLANASYTFKEIAHQIRDGRPRIAFVHPTLMEAYAQAVKLLEDEGQAIPLSYWAVPEAETPTDPKSEHLKSYESLMTTAQEVQGLEGLEAEGDEAYDTALLCYSSGTVSPFWYPSCNFARLMSSPDRPAQRFVN